MQSIVCQNCKSEYDVEAVATEGWDREPADEVCEVCGATLRRWDPDHQPIFILTKRGVSPEIS
jgi:rRNA maturation endonuclease Nob1